MFCWKNAIFSSAVGRGACERRGLFGTPSLRSVTPAKPEGLNSLYLSGPPPDTRVVVAMSGGVDFLRGRGPAEERGL